MEIKAYCFVKTFGMCNERVGPFLPHCTEAPMLIVVCERLQERESETDRQMQREREKVNNINEKKGGM